MPLLRKQTYIGVKRGKKVEGNAAVRTNLDGQIHGGEYTQWNLVG